MDVVDKIQAIIAPSLSAMGYVIVQLKLSEGAKRKSLVIMAERADEVMMSFDDCTEISRTVSALLDVEDPIAGAYNLEVCSPGVDRPLTQLADYTKYKGYEVKLETLIPIEGRKRFKGILGAPQNDNILITTTEGNTTIAYRNIRNAKLVMTDELMREFLKKQGN